MEAVDIIALHIIMVVTVQHTVAVDRRSEDARLVRFHQGRLYDQQCGVCVERTVLKGISFKNRSQTRCIIGYCQAEITAEIIGRIRTGGKKGSGFRDARPIEQICLSGRNFYFTPIPFAEII